MSIKNINPLEDGNNMQDEITHQIRSEEMKITSEALEESSLAQPAISNNKLCGICKANEFKYKCSRCYLPYCSIACSNTHKATHTVVGPKSDQPEPKAENRFDGTAAATGSKGPFAALDESKELRTLFNLYPGLPTLLEEIDKTTLPPSSNPQNRDFGMARGRKEEPWNLDRGLQKGVQALSRARNADGKDAESLREYSKLILQILSGEAAESAAQIIQKEVAADNAKFIEALLKGER